jgi:NAD(P)-dependent dehydrogenase (short-subunit alcohol dehydrogenase family)
VSSVASFRTWAGLGAYGVSKAAVNMMTQVLAAEAGPYGIRVNGVAPGLIRTRFSEALWKDPSKEEAAAARLPLRRIGEPEDIAGVAVFLASDASRYVTGQTLPADGGMMVGDDGGRLNRRCGLTRRLRSRSRSRALLLLWAHT